MIHVVGFNYTLPESAVAVNVTSRSSGWSRSLSPFYLGPCKLYGDYVSKNVENGYQYAKVYEYYLEDDGTVGERYFNWAKEGWNRKQADRYPMGKDTAPPVYSLWDGEKLSYTEARKKIYVPIYSEAVRKTHAFAQLQRVHAENETIYLQDFDAHSLEPGTFEYSDLWDNDKIKVGHAYVLAMMLEGLI